MVSVVWEILIIIWGNTEELGWVLYIDYLILFEFVLMLLLVVMIGVIVFVK